MNGPSTIYHALNASFTICRKDRKIVARKLGAKCKGDKTCIWVPKTIVTNLVGPNLEEEGIKHEFSAPYTPQQNGVVERKNRMLIDMARTMLGEFKTPERF